MGTPTRPLQLPLLPQVVPAVVYHAVLRVPYCRLSECECAPVELPVEPTRPSGQRSQVLVAVSALAFEWS